VKVKDVMSREVVTVDKDERLDHVLETMRKHRMSKLVVVEKGKVAGIVTDGDIADELGALKNKGVPASHLHASSAMRRQFLTTVAEADVAKLVPQAHEDGAGLVPVMHDHTCVGVVTASDLLRLVASTAPLEGIMTQKVLAVQPTDRVIHARRLMVDHHVERLPVLDGGRLVGILGESDIAFGLARFKESVRDNHQASALQRFLVEDVYQRNVVTGTVDMPARDAAQRMLKEDVGCLPVLRGDRLVGIVTRSDLIATIK
jgi:CBS domain-containing protein